MLSKNNIRLCVIHASFKMKECSGCFFFPMTDINLHIFQPPRIGGVKVYTKNVRRDEIYMDLDIM
jgi:hypothetical protein